MAMARGDNMALVALHYQNDVVHPDGKIRVGLQEGGERRGQLLTAAEALLGRARARSMPIIHVRVAYRADGADIIRNAPIFRNVAQSGAVIDGTWGSEFYPTLCPRAGSPREFVVKHSRINAFFGSQLEEVLRVVGASRLLVAGVATHSVVESTVRHAVDLGFEVAVDADACAAADVQTHLASLRSMSLIATVLDTQGVERLFQASE